MARQKDKQRRTIPISFGPDPKTAQRERAEVEKAFKASGSSSRNQFLKDIVMWSVRKLNERGER